MAIKVAVFDLDGTVLDTISSIAHFCNVAMEKFGISSLPVENYKYYVGNGAKNLVHRALNAQNADTEENFNKVFSEYMESYDSNPTYKTGHFDGLPEVLEKMREKGIVLGIVSNKPESTVLEVIPKFFPDGFFKYVYGSLSKMPLKPDPAAIFHIMKEENANKDEVLYVGDSGVDMETGKNAGVLTVGVSWGFRSREELAENGADAVIDTPSRLLDFLGM